MTPSTLAEVPTPALIVDVAALDRNIARMARFFAEGTCRLRPHVKAHKTPEIARRQLAAGSCVGLTCATVREAEAVAGFCGETLGRLRGRPAFLSLDKVRDARGPHWVCDSEAIGREVGWSPRTSFAEGSEQTARWYRDQGLL